IVLRPRVLGWRAPRPGCRAVGVPGDRGNERDHFRGRIDRGGLERAGISCMTEQPAQRSGRLVVVPARALDDARLRPAAFRVLCALSTYGDRDGRCWPSLRSVGKRLGIRRRAVQRQIRELGELGYLEIVPRSRENGSTTSNGYRLLFDGELAI